MNAQNTETKHQSGAVPNPNMDYADAQVGVSVW
jgi:hypothetical protein